MFPPKFWAHFGPIADPVQHRGSVFESFADFCRRCWIASDMKLAPLLQSLRANTFDGLSASRLRNQSLALRCDFGEARDQCDECVVRIIYIRGHGGGIAHSHDHFFKKDGYFVHPGMASEPLDLQSSMTSGIRHPAVAPRSSFFNFPRGQNCVAHFLLSNESLSRFDPDS